MRVAGVFVLVCIAALVSTAASLPVPCEKSASFGSVKTCYMLSASINSKNFSISSDQDESVKRFNAFDNNNLQHLPNNIGAKFPNLLGLHAFYCSIKEVEKANFEGLSHLRYLNLKGNQIERIDDDTFDHIPTVEQIHLSENKIKKLNGRAFAALHKLTKVDLRGNECINEEFLTAERIAGMLRTVTEKCGFVDPEPSSMKIVEPEADPMAQSRD